MQMDSRADGEAGAWLVDLLFFFGFAALYFKYAAGTVIEREGGSCLAQVGLSLSRIQPS